MNPWLIDAIGVCWPLLTTFCWLAASLGRRLRERDTRAISFPANLASAVGSPAGSAMGPGLPDWPLIGSALITLLPCW